AAGVFAAAAQTATNAVHASTAPSTADRPTTHLGYRLIEPDDTGEAHTRRATLRVAERWTPLLQFLAGPRRCTGVTAFPVCAADLNDLFRGLARHGVHSEVVRVNRAVAGAEEQSARLADARQR